MISSRIGSRRHHRHQLRAAVGRLHLERLEDRRLLAYTELLADLDPSGSSTPSGFTAIGSTAYFSARTPEHGRELWKTDGTAAGTSMIADLNPNAASSFPGWLTNAAGMLYFSTSGMSHSLWRLQGSTPVAIPGTAGLAISEITNVGGTVYFTTYGTNLEHLYRVNSDLAGVTLLASFRNDSAPFYGAENFIAVGNKLFFAGSTSTNGHELWVTDGTPTGTRLVKDIRTTPSPAYGSGPLDLISYQGKLYFSAYSSEDGVELWSSDGTLAGTTMVHPLPGSGGLYPRQMTIMGGILYFSAGPGNNRELWRSDGTTAGTWRVKSLDPASVQNSIHGFLASGNRLYFQAYQSHSTGAELWVSDGTEAGTFEVVDINPGTHSSQAFPIVDAQGTLYFQANDGISGTELWKTQGTAATTQRVTDFPADSYVDFWRMVQLGDRFLFSAEDNSFGAEPWVHVRYSPPIVQSPISDIQVLEGGPSRSIDIANVFRDIDEQPLHYTVSTSDPSIVSASITGTEILLEWGTLANNLSSASATVTVLATDTDQLTTADTFSVRLNRVVLKSAMIPIVARDAEIPFELNVESMQGAPAENYRRTVRFTSSDPLATLPEDFSFQEPDSGTHDFTGQIVLRTLGEQSIIVTDTTNPSIRLVWSTVVVPSLDQVNAGGLDTTFGNLGSVVIGVPEKDSRDDPLAMAYTSQGHQVIFGRSLVGGNQLPGIYLANSRIDSDGSVTKQVLLPGYHFSPRFAKELPDGKFLVAGHTSFDGIGQIGVMRFLADLTIDYSFGFSGSGLAYTGIQGSVKGLALAPSGKIAVLGSVADDFAILQLLANGNLDTSFGNAGVAKFDFGGSQFGQARQAIYLPNNAMVVAGVVAADHTLAALVKLHPNGTLDTSFAGTGWLLTGGGNESAEFEAISSLSDGRIIATGLTWPSSSTPAEILAARLLTDGTLDTSFSGDGFATAPMPSDTVSMEVSTMGVLNDGSLLVFKGALVKFLPDGSIDSTYGGQGWVSVRYDSETYDNSPIYHVAGAAIEGNGSVHFAGTAINPNSSDLSYHVFAAQRMTPAGRFDVNFAEKGYVIAPPHAHGGVGYVAGRSHTLLPDGSLALAGFSSRNYGDYLEAVVSADGQSVGPVREYDRQLSWDQVRVIVAQPDGKSILAGNSQNDGFLMMRVMPNSQFQAPGRWLDPSFANGGVFQDVYLHFAPDVAVVQPDGKILLAGKRSNFFTVGQDRFEVLRFNANGTLDTTFGTNGWASILAGTDIDDSNSRIDMELMADGKILLAGMSRPIGSTILRLNANGSLDTNFANQGFLRLPELAVYTGWQYDHFLELDTQGRWLVGAGSKVARFVNGVLDASFGNNGIASHSFGGFMRDMVVDAEDKILLLPTNIASKVRMVRLRNDGSLDTFFGENGLASQTVANGPDFQSMSIHDGRILVSGSIGTSAAIMAFHQYHEISQFAVSGPTEVASNVPIVLSISAHDAFSELVGDYTGNVQFSSSDPLAVLPSNHTFQMSDHGSITITDILKLVTPGLQTITVTDIDRATILGTLEILVTSTTSTWTGAGESPHWDDSANWLGGNVPGPGSDVIISTEGTSDSIVIDDAVSIHSLIADTSISIHGGELNIRATSLVEGNVEIVSGLLSTEGNLTIAGQLSNDGTVRLGNADLNVVGGLTDWNSGVLTNGAWVSTGGGLILPSYQEIESIGSGSSVTLIDVPTTLTGLEALASNAGVLTLAGNTNITLDTEFSNQGTIQISPDSALLLPTDSQYIQFSGQTIVNGLLMATTINIDGGELRGSGNVVGNVINSGVMGPGNSPGAFAVDGNFSQSSLGLLSIEIAGGDPGNPLGVGTQFDRLIVEGTVSLTGSLELTFSNGYLPEVDTAFVIIDNDSSDPIQGVFDDWPSDWLVWIGSIGLQVSYSGGDGNDLVLQVMSVVNKSWIGEGGDQLWSNPQNWSDNSVPGVNDSVVIPDLGDDAPIVVSGAGWVVHSIYAQHPLIVAGSLKIDHASTFGESLRIVNGGEVSGAGSLTVSGVTTLDPNTRLYGPGRLNALGGLQVSTLGHWSLIADREVHLGADATHEGNELGQPLYLKNSSLHIPDGLTLTMIGESAINNWETPNNLIDNQGTIRKISGENGAIFTQLENHGALLIESGNFTHYQGNTSGVVNFPEGKSYTSFGHTYSQTSEIAGNGPVILHHATVAGSFDVGGWTEIHGTVHFTETAEILSVGSSLQVFGSAHFPETLALTLPQLHLNVGANLYGIGDLTVSGVTTLNPNTRLYGPGRLNALGGLEVSTLGHWSLIADREVHLGADATHEGNELGQPLYLKNSSLHIPDGLTLTMIGESAINNWETPNNLIDNQGTIRKISGENGAIFTQLESHGALLIDSGNFTHYQGNTSGVVNFPEGKSYTSFGHTYSQTSEIAGNGPVILHHATVAGSFDVGGWTEIHGTVHFTETAEILSVGSSLQVFGSAHFPETLALTLPQLHLNVGANLYGIGDLTVSGVTTLNPNTRLYGPGRLNALGGLEVSTLGHWSLIADREVHLGADATHEGNELGQPLYLKNSSLHIPDGLTLTMIGESAINNWETPNNLIDNQGTIRKISGENGAIFTQLENHGALLIESGNFTHYQGNTSGVVNFPEGKSYTSFGHTYSQTSEIAGNGPVILHHATVAGSFDVGGWTEIHGTVHFTETAEILSVGSSLQVFGSAHFPETLALTLPQLHLNVGANLYGIGDLTVSGVTTLNPNTRLYGPGRLNALGGLQVSTLGHWSLIADREVHLGADATHEGNELGQPLYLKNSSLHIPDGLTLTMIGESAINNWETPNNLIDNQGTIRKISGENGAIFTQLESHGALLIESGNFTHYQGNTSGVVNFPEGKSYTSFGHTYSQTSEIAGNGPVILHHATVAGSFDVGGWSEIHGTVHFTETAEILSVGSSLQVFGSAHFPETLALTLPQLHLNVGANLYGIGDLTVSGVTTLNPNTRLYGPGRLNALGGLQVSTLGHWSLIADREVHLGADATHEGNELGQPLYLKNSSLHIPDGLTLTMIGESAINNWETPNNLIDNQGTIRKISGENGVVSPSINNLGFVDGSSTGLTFSGLVTGSGDFGGTTRFFGGFSPGNSPAEVAAENITFGSYNTYRAEIGGLIAGDEFDQVNASGTVVLDGTLEVLFLNLGNGYTPVAGQSFDIITANNLTGTFVNVNLPTLPTGLNWDVVYQADRVTLEIEQAMDIVLSANIVLERAIALANAETIGTLSAVDPDAGDTHTFALINGVGPNDNSFFSIAGDALSIKAGTVVDFETKPSYVVHVQVTDTQGDSFAKDLLVMVGNRGEMEVVTIGDGTAQRSRVTGLTVTFDSAVTIESDAFTVLKLGAGGGAVGVSFDTTVDDRGRTVAQLTFSGPFTEFGSLKDGNFELRINGSRITDAYGDLDLDEDGTDGGTYRLGDEATDNFFRLYGDVSGDRSVGLAEFNAFRATFGRSQNTPGFNSSFDFNGDATIGLFDFNEFRKRFGTSI